MSQKAGSDTEKEDTETKAVAQMASIFRPRARDKTKKQDWDRDRKASIAKTAKRNEWWVPRTKDFKPIPRAQLDLISSSTVSFEQQEVNKIYAAKVLSVKKVRDNLRELIAQEVDIYPPGGKHDEGAAEPVRTMIERYGWKERHPNAAPIVCDDDTIVLYNSGVPRMLDGLYVIVNSDKSVSRCKTAGERAQA